MAVRPYVAADRAKVLPLVGDGRVLDSPGHRVHVAEEGGRLVGAVVWREPDPSAGSGQATGGSGAEAQLGGVVVSEPGRWDLFYGLVAATARDALARGFLTARFTVYDSALLAKLERDFSIEPEPSGWEPATREPVQWDVVVDIADALRQLARVGEGR